MVRYYIKRRKIQHECQTRTNSNRHRRTDHRRHCFAAGLFRQSLQHGLLHCLLPAGYRWWSGSAPCRRRTVHPARDHRSGAGQLRRGACQEGVLRQGRQRSCHPVCAGLLRDGGLPDVPGLPLPHDPASGRRRPERPAGSAGLCAGYSGRCVLPEAGAIP